MSNSKRQWTKPQLIVLARGTPEESVLTFCKFIGAGFDTGANYATQDACAEVSAGNCGACQARPPSGS